MAKKVKTTYISITEVGNPFKYLEQKRSFFKAKDANEYKTKMTEKYSDIKIKFWVEVY